MSGDTYVEQLFQVFKSCDVGGSGLLGNDELFELCMRLQLDDQQTNFIITNLIGNDLIAKVSFIILVRGMKSCTQKEAINY